VSLERSLASCKFLAKRPRPGSHSRNRTSRSWGPYPEASRDLPFRPIRPAFHLAAVHAMDRRAARDAHRRFARATLLSIGGLNMAALDLLKPGGGMLR